jgi:heme/copper-type cytochrome/quinol oxidase subunit 3
MVEQTVQERPVELAASSTSIDNRKLAVWFFLASEIIFFTALIGGSLLLRFNTGEWVHPGVILNVPLTSVNTFILICSSLTVVNALSAIEVGNQRMLRRWLVLTALLGITFLGIQVYEYAKLLNEGLTLQGMSAELCEHAHFAADACPNMYATTFYIQTGFHGSHVFVGVVWLLVVVLKAFRGVYTQAEHTGVELFGLYWHFVDLVWILLFTIVYLI